MLNYHALCHSRAFVVLSLMFLAFTGETCSDSTPLPSCFSKYESNADAPILDIKLSYNLVEYSQKLKDAYYDIYPDLVELQAAHPYFFADSPRGTFDSFYSILINAGNYASGNKPLVQFSFLAADCTGEMVKSYNAPDDDLMYSKIIKDAPDMRGVLKQVVFKAQSIKTNMNGLQLLWAQTINAQNMGGGQIVVSAGGDQKSELDYVLKNSNREGTVALRYFIDRYELVENSIISFSMDEVVRAIDAGNFVADEDTVFSPVLTQDVYSGGELRSSVKWLQPTVVRIL